MPLSIALLAANLRAGSSLTVSRSLSLDSVLLFLKGRGRGRNLRGDATFIPSVSSEVAALPLLLVTLGWEEAINVSESSSPSTEDDWEAMASPALARTAFIVFEA
ncbi:hypothetical protein EW146_g744 [Bondarzewia mesenterica]|uniref:Uncharacterized protein n=1 Tax=Bondarzewia mesenterica TaxID=1095465 RepID=A0A4S4M6G5_9AGAM|nr:hypothetical protein EW146_g744 [Bondarzewia mesenterica]